MRKLTFISLILCMIAAAVLPMAMATGSTGTELGAVAITASGPLAQSGQQAQLTVVGTMNDGSPAHLSGAAIVFSSSNSQIATVTSSGIVSIVSNGAASITAAVTLSGVTVTSSLLVGTDFVPPLALEEIVPMSEYVFLNPNETAQLELVGVMNDGSEANMNGASITYSSSHPSRATVSSAGVITAVNTSAATITITASLNGVVKTAKVHVNRKELMQVVSSSATNVLLVGGSTQISVAGLMSDESEANLSGASIQFASNEPSLLTVSSSGWVTALAQGEASVAIQVTLGGVTHFVEHEFTISGERLFSQNFKQLEVDGFVDTGNRGESFLTEQSYGILARTATGDSVTFIAYVPESGNYEVKLQGRQGSYGGQASVYWNGSKVNTIEFYAPDTRSWTKTIMLTGLSAGEHLLRFETTGKQAASSGTFLYLGDLAFVKAAVNSFEDLPITGKNPADLVTQPYSTNFQVRTKEVGHSISFQFDVLEAASYAVKLSSYKSTAGGIAEIQIDGKKVGSTDFYSASSHAAVETIGVRTLNAGTHTITFIVIDKQAASSNHYMYLKSLALTKLNGQHFESLPITAKTTNLVTQPYSTNFQVRTQAPGQFIAFSFHAPISGMYDISFYGLKSSNGGIADLFIDGTKIGEFDFYAPESVNSLVTYSLRHLTAGTHEIRFVVTGKQAVSGYYMYLKELAVTH